MAFDGQGVSNGTTPFGKHAGPRGLSSLDIIVQGGFLALGSGPVEYAAWLREPINAIVDNLLTVIDDEVGLIVGPYVVQAQAFADQAEGSAEAAEGDATTAQDAASDAQDSADAAAASAASILAALATKEEIRAGTVTDKFMAPKQASDSINYVEHDAGEYSAGTWTPDCTLGFNRKFIGLAANLIVAAPTGLVDGQTYNFLAKQDGTGGHTITLNAIFDFGNETFSAVTTANKVAMWGGTYSSDTGLIHCHYWKSA